LEFGLIIVFLFSADRHLSEWAGAVEHRCGLLDLLKEAPFKRRSSYQVHHRDVVILMKGRATLTAVFGESIA
jgi:hypothetical protein